MKKNVGKRFLGAVGVVLACASLVTGCSSSINLDTPVAVVNDEKVPFGVAKFYAKSQQAMYESYYGSLFGENMWDQALSADMTFGQSTLEGILEEIKEMYVVAQHADEYEITLTEEENSKIAETAKKLVADNDNKALEVLGANEQIIKEYLTKSTLKNKIEAAIKAGADTNVADEDAAQKTFSYVYIATDKKTDESGNAVDMTEEEKEAKKAEAEALVDEIAGGKDFETAVTDTGRVVSSASYGKDDDAGLDVAVITAADALQEGETSPVVETELGCYILNLKSAFDEEQTQIRREEIITERQNTIYNDTYTKWKDGSSITVDEKIWKKINFDDKITISSSQEVESTDTSEPALETTTQEDVPEEDVTTQDSTTTAE